MQTFDLIVIGSGPAGQRAAIQGAKSGKRVALVESREVLGGACINTGTIPSKTMREAVLHLSGFYYQNIYGINYRVKEKISMSDSSFRVQLVIKTKADVTQAQLTRNGVEVLTGIASFVNPHHIKVINNLGQIDLEAGAIIIATGTKPADSPKVPLNGRTIVNSDQILQMPDIPKTLIVVGGGVIGVEYTCMFATLGVRVILVEKRPRLLEFADAEIVEALSYHLRDHRVTMRLNEEVESVEEAAGGSVVGAAYYREIARGQIRGDTTGRLKVIFHRETKELLGVHIIGEGASELLHIGQAVLILQGKVDYFVDTVFNYPTLAECYKAAAFNGVNKLSRW